MTAASDALLDGFVRDFTEISTLDLGGDTRKGKTKSLFGRSVCHLTLYNMLATIHWLISQKVHTLMEAVSGDQV